MQKQMIPKAHIIINIHLFLASPPPRPLSIKQKETDEEGEIGEVGRQEEKEEGTGEKGEKMKNGPGWGRGCGSEEEDEKK